MYGLHERAAQFAQELQAAGFVIFNDVVFNQVLVGLCNKSNKDTLGSDAANRGDKDIDTDMDTDIDTDIDIDENKDNTNRKDVKDAKGENDINDRNALLLLAVQKSGECWVGGSIWRGKAVIRVSVCSWVTTAEDVTRSVLAFIKARDSIDSK